MRKSVRMFPKCTKIGHYKKRAHRSGPHALWICSSNATVFGSAGLRDLQALARFAGILPWGGAGTEVPDRLRLARNLHLIKRWRRE